MDKSIDILNRTILCHAETIYRKNGVWEGPNPLNPILPAFILQLTISIMASRFFLILLKPFNQPPFVAEILGGIMLGPSGLGRMKEFQKLFFPTYSFPVLEPMAHFALVYYAFLMGLEMDIRAIMRTGSKARNTFIASFFIPFSIGLGLFFIFGNQNPKGSFFWGTCLTITGFSVLSRLLEKQKLLHTEAGKTALAAALINELWAWVLLALGLAISSSGSTVHWAIMCTSAIVVIMVYVVRPSLLWMIRRTPEGQGYSEFYVCFILMGVALCGVLTDACGTHPMIGAFVFGLIIPNEVLEATLVDRLEDFVLGIFMPAFFTVCGLRTNVDVITNDGTSWVVVVVVIVVVCCAKLLSSIVVTFFSHMPLKEAITVGILSNTKGIMSMIFLEVGQEQGALSTQTYTIMVIAVVVMTMIVTPITMFNHPKRKEVPYKRRTIQKAKDEDLKILACVHGMRNVHSVINLLEVSNSSSRSPINVFAVHLVELIGRAAATLVVHSSRKAGTRNHSYAEAQTEQIISAFDNYELRCDGVSVQALTARSSYNTMDEDICSIAKDKTASFIVLPYHKLQMVDGDMDDINPAIRSVNENVMANAPCSVGILIDRGLSESGSFPRRIVMIYMGGPDDREALAYAWRMAENENIQLNVVRFVPSTQAYQGNQMEFMAPKDAAVAVNVDDEKEKVLDNEFLNKFKIGTVNDNTILFSEVVLNDEEETVKTIKSMDGQFDFYLVGKGRGIVSPLTAGLSDWCDCPELGAIGDLLATSEFSAPFAVLVVQQYVKFADGRDGSMRSGDSVLNSGEDIEQVEWRTSVSDTDDFASFNSAGAGYRDHSN